MSLTDVTFRHQCILRKLQRGPASLQELKDFYDLECEIHGFNNTFSNRNFLRDKDKIFSLYKKDIQYNAQTKKYCLEDDEPGDDFGERISDAYNTYLALNMADSVSSFVHLEKRRPQGMEHFQEIMQSLQKSLIITFQYEKYYGNERSERRVEPLAIKEFKSRWYLIAKDLKDSGLKTFALDRISSMEVTGKKFKADKTFQVQEYYRNCFGIIRPSDSKMEPEHIELAFKGDKGKYIKSLPLHDSQVIIADTEQELQISLKLYITHDLIMELLSHGEDVTVLKPESVRETMKDIFLQAASHY